MRMLSFIFVIVCGLFVCKRICAGLLSYVYICIAIGDSSYQERNVGIPWIGLTPPLLVSVSNQDQDFKRNMSWTFLCLVSSVNMRGDSWLCWYWWNWWRSLFKISFQNTWPITIRYRSSYHTNFCINDAYIILWDVRQIVISNGDWPIRDALVTSYFESNFCWWSIRFYLQGLRGHNSKSTDR
jgi:hypothetical protein